MVVVESEHRARPQYDVGEDILSLREIISIILSRLWVIVLVVLVVVGVTVGFSFSQTPTYESSVKILVGQREEAGTSSTLGSDISGLQQLTKTLSVAVSSYPVAEAVTEQLNSDITPEELLENLEAQQIPETQFIQVTYSDPSPERARLVADTVGEVFSEQISEVSPRVYAVTATVWEPAEVPDEPVSPDLKVNILMALVVGLALGVGLAFLLEYAGAGGGFKAQDFKKRR